jgi:hypothetical protein
MAAFPLEKQVVFKIAGHRIKNPAFGARFQGF